MGTMDEKILKEIRRHQSINKYIYEQDTTAPPAPDEELPTDDITVPPTDIPAPPPAPEAGTEPEVVNPDTDPDVEKIDNTSEPTTDELGSEELDITDLVTTQKDISQKQDDYFEQLFAHLESLESRLSEMDSLMDKINSLESKIEKYRPKTPQEKLELRSLDSGPFNQKLTDFFIDKEIDMEKSGKNEYVLTSDDVQNFSPNEIRDTFTIEPKKNFGI